MALEVGAIVGIILGSLCGIWCLYQILSCCIVGCIERGKEYGKESTAETVLKNVDLSGKVILITGTSDGLGKLTAQYLLKAGAKLYMLNRNQKKAEKAKQDILENNKDINQDQIELLTIDLASLQSVHDCAKTIKEKDIKPHFLINNAGVMGIPEYKETKDGVEFQWGVNHLGHFYLVQLILPILKENKTRIINLASYGHQFGTYEPSKEILKYGIKNKCFMGDKKTEYGAFFNYGISKSANILFTRELNELYRNDGIYSVAIHPGSIASTNLASNISIKDVFPFLVTGCIRPYFYAREFKSLEQGIAGTCRGITLTNDEIKNAKYQYYYNCRPEKPKDYSMARYNNNECQKLLWQLSEVIIKDKGFPMQLE